MVPPLVVDEPPPLASKVEPAREMVGALRRRPPPAPAPPVPPAPAGYPEPPAPPAELAEADGEPPAPPFPVSAPVHPLSQPQVIPLTPFPARTPLVLIVPETVKLLVEISLTEPPPFPPEPPPPPPPPR